MKYILTSILVCVSLFINAQSYQINGQVLDAEETPLIGATVVVLDKDTTMIAFGITDDSGNYEIYDIPRGNQILQISYTGYMDHSSALILDGLEHKMQLGTTVLQVSSEILEEVSIKAEHIPMGILGDTINYNAAAFKTRAGASVEDLLKKLPGIEVARDGSIKAQGKDVQNVLVDGKEFFSGDVTIATKNLEAEAVDKVQVYDKKSEEAEFTGVDDGQEEKTLNLKLKEGYKNGGFGKASIEGGTENTRQAKLNYNRFGPSLQASFIGNSNNINEQAFSFKEYVDFMGGFQNMIAAGGFSGFDGFSSSRQGSSGINDQTSIGTNLNLQLSEKLKMNANYLFASKDNDTNGSSISQNFTTDRVFTTIDTSVSDNKVINHRLNTKLKFNPNPMNAFTWTAKMFSLNNDNRSIASTLYKLEESITNTTNRQLNTDAQSYSINTSLLYKKKFSTKGRNVIARATYENVNSDESSDINNALTSSTADERIIQMQQFNNGKKVIKGSIDYTEPLGKKIYLGIDYSFKDEDQNPQRNYFDKEDDLLSKLEDISNTFNKKWTTQSLGLSLKRNRKKLKLNLGLNYQMAELIASEGGDVLNQMQKLNYILPMASTKFKLKGGKSLDLDYYTSVASPSLNQMVTQVNNLNPNTIILGNPNLKPEYLHTFSLGYNFFDSFNFSNLLMNINLGLSPNKIVNSRTINDDFVTEILPINASNYQQITGYINHSSPIRKLKLKYSIDSRMVYSKYNTLIDNIESNISTATGTLGLSLENRNKDYVDIKGGAQFDISAYSNEFNSNFNDPFLNYSLYLDGYVDLGKGWLIGSKYDLVTFNSGFLDQSQVQHLWNANLTKTFMDSKLNVKLTAHDLLNQNTGISRSGGINTLSDNRYNVQGRYIMIGLSYKLGKTKKKEID